jgi:hypothetical protein
MKLVSFFLVKKLTIKARFFPKFSWKTSFYGLDTEPELDSEPDLSKVGTETVTCQCHKSEPEL